MKTLREQVRDATTTVYGSSCAEQWSLTFQLRSLAEYYFENQTPECPHTRAVRRAIKLLGVFPYIVANDEPAVD